MGDADGLTSDCVAVVAFVLEAYDSMGLADKTKLSSDDALLVTPRQLVRKDARLLQSPTSMGNMLPIRLE